MELSSDELRRAEARHILGYLIRETLNVLPPDSPERARAGNLGYTPRLDRAETAERHRIGMDVLRTSRDVMLAFARLEHNSDDPKGRNRAIAYTNPWYAEVEPVLRSGSEHFQRDRFGGIFSLVSEVCGLIERRYGAIPPAVVIGLTRASVAAYGYGFFIRYNVEHPRERPAEAETESGNQEGN